jgi:hypothetical protein
MQRDLLQQIDREDMEKHYRKTYQTGSKALFFGQNLDQNDTWVPLIEKAYAKAHGDYGCLTGGWIGEALEDLTGGVTTELFTSDILDLDDFWDNEMSKVNQEFLFGCSTGIMERGYGSRDGISEGHAYVVMDARTLKSGQRLVKLRNPWGKIRKGLWEGPWSDGSKEWTTEVQEELGHRFGSDSVFWIAYEDLINKYTLLDRTRLFRERDWRCCQRWIGVDVPWKPDYHEKFQIKLTKESPLVIKLTQLDERYFKGLQGQYSFRLYFRLHNQDSPGGEDYIVRSHGNYCTYRSVSVELADMPPGDYVVYVKVVGERDSTKKSVEQVVKKECLERTENEKLAQVGYAYDLAHSKAWDHMNKVAKVRKKKEQQKASKCRNETRRHNWEKRHLNREATRKQAEKNKEKKQKRREAWEEEQRLKREAEEKEAKEKEAKENETKEKETKEKAKDPKSDSEGEKKTAAGRKVAAKKGPVAEAKAGDEADDEDDGVDDDGNGGDNDKEAVSKASSDSSGSPQFTPKTEHSVVAPSSREKKQDVPPVSGGPPSAPTPPAEDKAKGDEEKPKSKEDEKKPAKPEPKYDEANDSSDSPVAEWDEIYSSDDMTRKPRLVPQPPPQPRDDYDTEEEKMPEPWNAVCIVGIRVYSKDPDLELRTVIEGGELLEDGMGEKGAADLDNAQANAGGSRIEDKNGNGTGGYVVSRDGHLLTPGLVDGKVRDYINAASIASSVDGTPMATPLEEDE